MKNKKPKTNKSELEEILSGKKSGVVDMRTGKVLITNEEITKAAKKWLKSLTSKKLKKMFSEIGDKNEQQ